MQRQGITFKDGHAESISPVMKFESRKNTNQKNLILLWKFTF